MFISCGQLQLTMLGLDSYSILKPRVKSSTRVVGFVVEDQIYGVKSSGPQFGSRAELNAVTRTALTSIVSGNYLHGDPLPSHHKVPALSEN